MYHYRECGLPNVFLLNGFQEIETANGRAVSIQNVEGLHEAISRTIISEAPFLTGPEFRFVRKFLDLTQNEMATYLGLDEQSIRRWERLERLPDHADKSVRLLFRDLNEGARRATYAELVEHLPQARLPTRFRKREGDEIWEPQAEAA